MWYLVLYGFAAGYFVAFNGDVLRELAEEFITRAEKERATAPMMVGHRLVGHALLLTGEVAATEAHYGQGLALYDPVEHRQFVRTGYCHGGPKGCPVLEGFRHLNRLACWLRPEKS